MDTLPQELVDAIVDILADDRCSLRTLCSASRFLRSQARVHFLRSAHFWSERSVLAFHNSCLLSPEIPNLVQNLSVTLGALRGLNGVPSAAAELRTSIEELLLSHPLPNVKALRLELGYAYDDCTSDIPIPLLSYPLTSLILKARFAYQSHLPDLLRHYPALRHLDVSTTRISPSFFQEEEEEVDQGVVLSIEDLTISGFILRFCLDKQLFAVHALRSIKLASFQLTWLHECQWLLENPNRALQRLHIYQPPYQGESYFAHRLIIF